MPTLPSVPNAFTWRLTGVVALAAVALGHAQGFSLHPRPLLIGAAIMACSLAAAYFYTVWRPSPDLAVPLMLPVYFVGTGLVFGLMSYVMASLNRPLIDAELAAVDSFLGFDWKAWHSFVAEHRWLAEACNTAYSYTGGQMFLAWAVLACTRQHERLSVMLAAGAIAAASVVIISGLLPAVGGFTYYGITPADFGYLGEGSGTSYLGDFHALRDGTLRLLDPSKTAGICQFPSFHTATSLISGWALLRTRWIRWPSVVFSGFVVLTTMPVGGHHLADVLGGSVICVAALAIAIRVQARQGVDAVAATEAVAATA